MCPNIQCDGESWKFLGTKHGISNTLWSFCYYDVPCHLHIAVWKMDLTWDTQIHYDASVIMMWHVVTSIFSNSGMLLLLWHVITSKWHVNTLLYTAGVLQTSGSSLFNICCFFRLLSTLLSSLLLCFANDDIVQSITWHGLWADDEHLW
jgi:hypothetical protein